MTTENPKIEQGGKNDEERIPGIPQYVVKYIQSGEIGPVYFHGQTVIIIPWEKYQKLGEQKILTAAAKIYEEKAMERDIRFFSGAVDKLYYHLELPPKQRDLLEKLLEDLNKSVT
jgi:hypothetical protein